LSALLNPATSTDNMTQKWKDTFLYPEESYLFQKFK